MKRFRRRNIISRLGYKAFDNDVLSKRKMTELKTLRYSMKTQKAASLLKRPFYI